MDNKHDPAIWDDIGVIEPHLLVRHADGKRSVAYYLRAPGKDGLVKGISMNLREMEAALGADEEPERRRT